ncbi:hypothetical protein SKAU_G00318660 [Synaphobranchus kaupii]|uniref:Uncharacterized protein n=1 Tax=Synaphobranchus kaupii TaxID=118154 RepID=A0A9Q1ET68_SYNKA|nr:hypothetical protein SKAU_G00318660 [Synaphobranchus kaupii]
MAADPPQVVLGDSAVLRRPHRRAFDPPARHRRRRGLNSFLHSHITAKLQALSRLAAGEECILLPGRTSHGEAERFFRQFGVAALSRTETLFPLVQILLHACVISQGHTLCFWTSAELAAALPRCRIHSPRPFPHYYTPTSSNLCVPILLQR